ncbi:hypothetical protein FNH04_01415 [Streptomyces phyllanthi]|uniref:Lipoprotein n=1 Tax=Streptomyces phyllanthi TaxID=1803180 RepID=A0A5N8VX72_9ACTN|nr:hypothetical protein [Streptomyces phyllanthi]
MRNAVLAGTNLAALTLLTGCTVPPAGSTGISVTEDGRPLGVIVVCHDHIDGATLYTHTDDGKEKTLARWSHADPVKGFTTWPLETGGQGWKVDRAMPTTLDRRRTYTLYGWTSDNSSSANHVSFTLAQLAGLKPGQVRYDAGDEADGADRNRYRTASFDDFRTEACEDE